MEKVIVVDIDYKAIEGIATIVDSYEETALNTLQAIVAENHGQQNNETYIEGECLLTMKNTPKKIDFHIDYDGNLIVVGNDANSYSINNKGELIWQN